MEERVKRKNSSGPEETIKGKTGKTYFQLYKMLVSCNEKNQTYFKSMCNSFNGEVPSGTKYTIEGLFKKRHTHDTLGVEIL